MVERRAVLEAIRDKHEDALWRLAREVSRTLSSLAQVPHFNADDDRAVGSAVHSTLGSAAAAARLEDAGLKVSFHKVGLAYKIDGLVPIGGVDRDINLEMHLAGPRGGTTKSHHQFCPDDAEAEQDPLFADEELPQTLLFFLAYHLSGARTRVERLFIVWADNRGTEKIELRQNESDTVETDDVKPKVPPPDLRPVLVRKGENKDAGNAGGQNKRGDAASGS